MSILYKIKASLKGSLRRFKKVVPVQIPVYQSSLLHERVALITGGTSGIGFEIARAFLSSGASVIISGRNNEKLEASCMQLRNLNSAYSSKVFSINIDNVKVEQFDEKFRAVLDLIGSAKLDILVNNAGVLTGGGFSEVTQDDYSLVLDTNLKGVYFLTQTVTKYMIENKIKGNVLNIASSSSLRPAISPYTLSKWGIKGFTIGLAKALAPYDIVVNGLAPGPTATPMLIKDDYDGIEHRKIPLQRYVTSEEIANMAVILTSSMGRAVMGDTVYMTGGAGVLTVDDIGYEI